jgi:hypothetical protein
MAARLKRAGRRSRYRPRKQTVEPVFGQIKQARGFRQFLLRGFSKVGDEWALICTAHNSPSCSAPAAPDPAPIPTSARPAMRLIITRPSQQPAPSRRPLIRTGS